MDIEKLKKRKRALKLTTAEVAYRAELPVSTVSKVFTGETKKPSYVTIEKIVDVIAKEEAYHRIVTYYNALYQYISDHPEDTLAEKNFEAKYREENDLTDMPIPYAVQKGTEGEYADDFNLTNLAFSKESLISLTEYYDMMTDKRDELLRGKVIYNQAPSRQHQDMVRLIAKKIDRYIEDHQGNCIVYDTGINVEVDEYNCLIPDIAVVCDKNKLNERGLKEGPELVIEVTSPSTRHRDYREKAMAYMDADTKEYWVVDLDKQKVAVIINGEPFITHLYDFTDDIPVLIYENNLTIRPADFT